MVSGHEFVDEAVWPIGGERLKGLGEPGVRIDAVELGGGEQRGHGRPGVAAAIGAANNAFLRVMFCGRMASRFH